MAEISRDADERDFLVRLERQCGVFVFEQHDSSRGQVVRKPGVEFAAGWTCEGREADQKGG